MPLLLLLPLLLAAAFALWVLLLPWSLLQRYRRGRARRRLQPWVVRVNAWGLPLTAALFLAGAWLLGHWLQPALREAAIGLLAGGLAGMVGLWLGRFEWASGRLYFTPRRWFALLVSGLLALRIALGLWLAMASGEAIGMVWEGLLDRSGLFLVGGVLLGIGMVSNWGWLLRLRGPVAD